jgi:hypothetical protein
MLDQNNEKKDSLKHQKQKTTSKKNFLLLCQIDRKSLSSRKKFINRQAI